MIRKKKSNQQGEASNLPFRFGTRALIEYYKFCFIYTINSYSEQYSYILQRKGPHPRLQIVLENTQRTRRVQMWPSWPGRAETRLSWRRAEAAFQIKKNNKTIFYRQFRATYLTARKT